MDTAVDDVNDVVLHDVDEAAYLKIIDDPNFDHT